MRSKHNSSYWAGKKYLGIGPSAHSFDRETRQWNITNNQTYIDSINKGVIPAEKEILSETQKLNEYIMTSLRTIEGLDLNKVGSSESGVRSRSQKFIVAGKMIEEEGVLKLTHDGKLFADGIAAELFF
jgi:oxygen-independent coproporphyrinogen-3 oxidase